MTQAKVWKMREYFVYFPFFILILDKIVQFIEKAPPDGVAEYVIFGIENHIFPSHVIL